jgi:23S rRNA pseudouridine2457 synthase
MLPADRDPAWKAFGAGHASTKARLKFLRAIRRVKDADPRSAPRGGAGEACVRDTTARPKSIEPGLCKRMAPQSPSEHLLVHACSQSPPWQSVARSKQALHRDRSPSPPVTLIAFNKPFGVLCQFSDPGGGGRRTLADFVTVPGVYPAGRLDQDSEGLLLLTDDGRLQARIADPRHKLPKTYWVQVEGEAGADALEALRTGVTLKDGVTRPALARRIDPPDLWPRDPPVRTRLTVPDCWLEIVLREGRNRQVRRMTAAVGHPTLRLVRQAIGDWTLAGLRPGEWRKLDARP